MIPIVGVTPYFVQTEDKREFRLGRSYCDKLQAAGCLPLVLPFDPDPARIRAMARLCDGFLFTGGEDIDPPLYGEEILPECGGLCRERDDFELALMAEAEKLQKPMLGICRGVQVMNVFYGGSLWQDLESQKDLEKTLHSPGHYREQHEVLVKPDTRLASILGPGPMAVNSSHHQAVKATRLTVCAVTADGLVEAVEQPGAHFVLGVQWHPERLEDLRLFEALAAACREK